MADSRSNIDKDDITLAKAFAQRAKEDMKSAKSLLKSGSYADSAYMRNRRFLINYESSDSQFHAQQCAEKIVKSLLILENQVVRTHITSGILTDVIDRFEDDEWKTNLQEVLPSLEDLERHWNLPRYPEKKDDGIWNPVEEYELEDAKDAIEKAEFVYETLLRFIKEGYGISLENS